MERIININGEIGVHAQTSLLSVIEQMKKDTETTSVKVIINSEGGEVETGFQIYDYLKSLKLPVTTVADGMCASIATVIFMAGDKRIVKDNSVFMIHLPWGQTMGTAEEIASYSEMVKEAEDRLLKFYVENTNNPKEAVLPLMQQETYLTKEQTLSLGFATEIEKTVSAKAYLNLNTNKMQTQLSKEDKTWIEKQFEKVQTIVNKFNVKSMLTLQDASGVSIDFTDLNEGDSPKIDDVATVDGAPAEGEYLMPDGKTVVFVGGVVTEIKEGSESSEEVEELKEQITELQEEKIELEQQLANAKLQFENLAKEVTALKSKISSRFDVNNKRKPSGSNADGEAQTQKRKLLKD